NARGPSSSTAHSRPAPMRTGDTRADSRTPSASPSECAGSVDTTSTRPPLLATVTARAAAHVVLPTPPLPPKKVNCGEWEGKRQKEDGCSSFYLLPLPCKFPVRCR